MEVEQTIKELIRYVNKCSKTSMLFVLGLFLMYQFPVSLFLNTTGVVVHWMMYRKSKMNVYENEFIVCFTALMLFVFCWNSPEFHFISFMLNAWYSFRLF